MRILVLAVCWAALILSVAFAVRFGWIERQAADLLLMVLPGIAFVTLIGRRDCRPTLRSA